MGNFVGGDILEITWNHSVLGSGTLKVKANEDSTFDTGGVRTNDDDAQVTTAGDNIRQLNNKRWSVECVCANDMNTGKDLVKVVAMAGHPVDAEWTVELINGTKWRGTGSPVGDLKGAVNGATFPLKLSGGGKLEEI